MIDPRIVTRYKGLPYGITSNPLNSINGACMLFWSRKPNLNETDLARIEQEVGVRYQLYIVSF